MATAFSEATSTELSDILPQPKTMKEWELLLGCSFTQLAEGHFLAGARITPTVARTILAQNFERQRKLRVEQVNDLSGYIQAGKFLPINLLGFAMTKPDANGRVQARLVNGQHTLSAIIQAGLEYEDQGGDPNQATQTLPMVIHQVECLEADGLDNLVDIEKRPVDVPFLYASYDSGKTRSQSDTNRALGLIVLADSRGIQHKLLTAASAAAVWAMADFDPSRISKVASRQRVKAFWAAEHEDAVYTFQEDFYKPFKAQDPVFSERLLRAQFLARALVALGDNEQEGPFRDLMDAVMVGLQTDWDNVKPNNPAFGLFTILDSKSAGSTAGNAQMRGINRVWRKHLEGATVPTTITQLCA